MMKLGALVGLVFGAAMTMTIGCGPGLSHHGAYAQTPSSASPAAAAAAPAAPAAKEVGTTTLTNDSAWALSESRRLEDAPFRTGEKSAKTQLRVEVRRPMIPAVKWDDDDKSGAAEAEADGTDDSLLINPGLQTWGQQLSIEEKYGF